MRVMIAGGGTGGHVYPGIAIYKALKRTGEHVDVLFVGARSGVEADIFAELGLPNVLLAGRGVRGKSLLSKLTSPVVFLVSTLRAVRLIMSFKPDVVVGTGGYASVAVVAGSVLCRRRRVLQEQNSVPGMANRLLSRFADLMLLSYDESRAFIPGRTRCTVVGNPLRIDVAPDREAGMRFFGLDGDLPTVLIFGGSRGAAAINEAAVSAVESILSKRPVQFVFLTGANNYESVAAKLRYAGDRVRVFPFLEEIQHAYSVADVAVSRAGASSVFELAAFGIPTVFVPYPYAADDHQKRNVAGLDRMNAAVVMDNRGLSGKELETIIISLLDDGERRGEMTEKMRSWCKADADDLAAEEIMGLVGKTGSRFALRAAATRALAH